MGVEAIVFSVLPPNGWTNLVSIVLVVLMAGLSYALRDAGLRALERVQASVSDADHRDE